MTYLKTIRHALQTDSHSRKCLVGIIDRGCVAYCQVTKACDNERSVLFTADCTCVFAATGDAIRALTLWENSSYSSKWVPPVTFYVVPPVAVADFSGHVRLVVADPNSSHLNERTRHDYQRTTRPTLICALAFDEALQSGADEAELAELRNHWIPDAEAIVEEAERLDFMGDD